MRAAELRRLLEHHNRLSLITEQIGDAWIKDLDAAGKKQFYDSYRGTYLKGKVVKSSAQTKGIANEQGALNGDTIYAMVGPPATQCAQLLEGLDRQQFQHNAGEFCLRSKIGEPIWVMVW